MSHIYSIHICIHCQEFHTGIFLQCGRILLLGKPGIGKSIFGCKIALDWCDLINEKNKASDAKAQDKASDNNQSRNMTQDISSGQNNDKIQDTPQSHDSDITQSEKKVLEQFSLLLHIDLSRIKPNSNLHDVISEQILVGQRQNIQSLINYMQKYPRKILLILDGWDKFNPAFCQDIRDIANGHSFPDATVLVTSHVRESTVMPKTVCRIRMIKGFSLSQAKQFIEKIFQLIKFTASGDDLVKFVTDNHLWGVFSAPLMLTYLCILYSTGSSLQQKVTDLFCSIIELSLGRHKLKKMKKPAADVKVTLSDYPKELLDLGKLAYLGLENKNTRTVFSQEEAVKIGGEAILDVGLLHKVRSESPLTPSCFLKFGHKSIQEFLAAVYVCNDERAFSKALRFIPIRSNESIAFSQFYKHLDSLIKVYDCQLFITFVCGLNAQYGQKLINKIKYIGVSDTATAAQCPEFSCEVWETDKPDDLVDRQTATASEVTPFLVQCCWEMAESDESAHSSLREGFPYKPVSALPAFTLEPVFNMNIVNIYNLTHLIQTSKVVFSEGYLVMLYNLSHNKENDKHITTLLDHISHNLTNTRHINITNMKSDIQCKSLTGVFNTIHKQGRLSVLSNTIYKLLLPKQVLISNVHLQPPDMQEVLHRLPQDLVWLLLDNVTLSGCEASLCEAVTRLISLRVLDLESLSLPGLYQEKLCEAVTGLTQLQVLNLYNTDMSAAGESLLTCLKALTLLTFLKLCHTQLTEDMTRAVVELLPSWPGLLLLSLAGLPVTVAVGGLRQGLPQLTKLRWLEVSDGGLDSQQLVEVFSSLPQSVQFLGARGNDTQDDIIAITKKLPSLPNLKYVFLYLHDVSADITQQLKAACQQAGTVIISSEQVYIQHSAALTEMFLKNYEWIQYGARLSKLLKAL